MTVSNGAEALGVSASTAHRLLHTLRQRGYAVQDGDRRFRPGPALLAPGLALATPQITERVRPYLESLFATVGETLHLMVLEGEDVRFLDGLESEQPLRVGLRTGVVLPARRTSGGKAILAERDAGEAAPPGRPLGFNRDESEDGVTALGASLGRSQGQWYAVGIALPSARFTAERGVFLRGHLLRTCEGVRELLAQEEQNAQPELRRP